VLGANDRIRCGVIGAGGRGSYLLQQFQAHGAEVAAVCDVYETRLDAARKAAGPDARAYVDYRKLLEDKSLDAVIIATPEHLHAPMLIDACAAGKDAYVEKPLAHSVAEGFQMVDAVRRAKRVVQVGSQRRSYDLYLEAKRLMDSGVTGPVRLVNAWWLNSWRSLPAPKLTGKVHWDLFLGPAPKRPFDPMRFVNWLQFWEYGNGIMVGQAAHLLDGIVWMMNSTFPTAVTAAAGKANLEGAEIPETSSMTVEYPENYILVFTIGYQAMRYRMFNDQMQQFHGMKARFDLGRESFSLWPESSAVDLKASAEKRVPDTFELASRAHIANFLDCMRSRKEPNAPIEVGNATNVALCMAIESMRSGRRVRFNAATKRTEA
jgi:predicted dehydrogenase